MVRLWPKLPCAATPEYVIELRPTVPIAFDAASMTALASWANALAGSRATTIAATARLLHMTTLPTPRTQHSTSGSRAVGGVAVRLKPDPTYDQSGVGFSMLSITYTSTGPFVASSLSPNCSWIAVNRLGA